MAEHPYAQIARDSLEAMNRGDIEGATGYVADDVVWHYIGSSEPLRGKAAVVEMFGGPAVDFTVSAELHDVTASDDHVVVLLKVHAERGGRTLDYATAEIYHVDADGKVTERWAFSDDTAAIAAFFA